MSEQLKYLEIPIVEYCNLNCKACSHFSPLAEKDDAVSVDGLKKDILRLAELVPLISKIRILGGEPLLHNDVKEIVQIVREAYPYADIRIVTNGLLIKKMKSDFWDVIRNNHITLDISMYPPTAHQWPSISEVLEREKIQFDASNLITKFRRRMTLKYRDDIKTSFEECVVGNECTCLYKGRIAACPAPFVVRHFNKYFKYDITPEKDTLDIYDPSLEGKDILTFVKKPLWMCGYCTKQDEIDWEVTTHPKEEDWVIGNN